MNVRKHSQESSPRFRFKADMASGSWPWSLVALCIALQFFLIFQLRTAPPPHTSSLQTTHGCDALKAAQNSAAGAVGGGRKAAAGNVVGGALNSLLTALTGPQAENPDGARGVAEGPGLRQESGPDRCEGRRVFVYDYLPRHFHEDLVENCSNPCTNHCDNLCPVLERDGLGSPLVRPEDAGSKEGDQSGIADKYGGATYSFQPWQGTQQNMIGVLFLARMRGYDCLTTDWEQANAFYIPALLGLRTLYGDHLPYKEIEALGDELETFLSYQPGFLRSGGRDHFLVVGQQIWDFLGKERTDPGKGWVWTTYMFYRPALENLTWVSVERVPWEVRAQSIPYLTAFHPASKDEVEEWVEHARWHPRKHMSVMLAGKRSHVELRAAVEKACQEKPEMCRLVDCSGECPRGSCRRVAKYCGEPRHVAREYLSATFCLNPNGDSATRRSTFDAMVAGCIPVFFDRRSFEWQYSWHRGALNHSDISVTFDRGQTINGTVDFLRQLAEIPEAVTSRMRENILSLVPSLVYRDHLRENGTVGEQFRDAFDVAVDGILGHLRKPERTPGF